MNIIRSIRPASWKLWSYSGKCRILIIAYSFFCVLFQFLGLLLDSESDNRLLKLILYIVISLGLSFILSEIILRINNKICHSKSAAKIVTGKTDKYYFLACWGIISLLWLPYFLAYYPGIISYDVTYQLFQEIGSYTTDHPLLHTLMLQGASWIGNTVFNDINKGMAVYTIFQMLATSASAAYMMLFLRRSGTHRIIRIFLLAFVSLFPVWPLLSISATKDILFADVFLLSAICIAYWCFDPVFAETGKIPVLYTLSIFIACLLRSSIYGFIIIVIAGSIFLIKKSRQ